MRVTISFPVDLDTSDITVPQEVAAVVSAVLVEQIPPGIYNNTDSFEEAFAEVLARAGVMASESDEFAVEVIE